MNELQGKTVAILVDTGFEQIEFTDPQRALEEAGAKTYIVSPQVKTVRARNHDEWADTFVVDVDLRGAEIGKFDALLIPGGDMSPDSLRHNESAQLFVRGFFDAGKPVAAICHGPLVLIQSGAASGRHLTSYPEIAADMRDAGADWVDEEVVVDDGLVTSRTPADLPAFDRRMIQVFHDHAAVNVLTRSAPAAAREALSEVADGVAKHA